MEVEGEIVIESDIELDFDSDNKLIEFEVERELERI